MKLSKKDTKLLAAEMLRNDLDYLRFKYFDELDIEDDLDEMVKDSLETVVADLTLYIRRHED